MSREFGWKKLSDEQPAPDNLVLLRIQWAKGHPYDVHTAYVCGSSEEGFDSSYYFIVDCDRQCIIHSEKFDVIKHWSYIPDPE